MTRMQFPIVAGFALTVNKAQGLTTKEGDVINLRGSARFRPASKHGFPFVAFTRSESFAMTAFKALPPLAGLRARPKLGHAADAGGMCGEAREDARANSPQARCLCHTRGGAGCACGLGAESEGGNISDADSCEEGAALAATLGFIDRSRKGVLQNTATAQRAMRRAHRAMAKDPVHNVKNNWTRSPSAPACS